MDQSTVNKVAHLARIAIDDNDMANYEKDLSNIFHLIDKLDALDIADIEPLNHPLEITQRLREDVVSATNDRDNLMKNAPAKQDGLFLVPTVIE